MVNLIVLVILPFSGFVIYVIRGICDSETRYIIRKNLYETVALYILYN